MKNKIYLITYVTLCLFLVLKLVRGLSGVESQSGGVWNYIQMFFCIQGFYLLLFKKVNNYPIFKTFMAFLYTCWAVSLLNMDTFIGSFPMLFKYAIFPYPGLVCVVFYYYGRKYGISKYNLIMQGTFYLLCALFIITLRDYRLTELDDNVAISDVYYPLALLPFVMAMTKDKYKLVPLIVAFLAVLFSGKRTGFIIVIVVGLVVYLFQPRTNTKKVMSNFLFIAVGVFLGTSILGSFVNQFDIDIISRLQNISEDGGSGRDERWAYLLNLINESNIFQLIFGHGYESVSIYLNGGRAHNDFLEVFFNFGIISFVLYILFYIKLIKEGIQMYKFKYIYSAEYLATVICALFLALFSFFIVEPTYITGCMFAISLFMADWNNYKTQIIYEK